MISAGHLLPDLYNQLGIIQKSCIGKSKNVETADHLPGIIWPFWHTSGTNILCIVFDSSIRTHPGNYSTNMMGIIDNIIYYRNTLKVLLRT